MPEKRLERFLRDKGPLGRRDLWADPRLREVVETAASASPPSLRDAITLSGLHRRDFGPYFMARAGESYTDWRRRVLLFKALHELRYSADASLVEIATEVGFGSLRSMERACQEFLGTSMRRARSDLRLQRWL